jgi:hypothetical protein
LLLLRTDYLFPTNLLSGLGEIDSWGDNVPTQLAAVFAVDVHISFTLT